MSLPLATSSWDDNEIEALQRVIDKNNYSMGEYVRNFENDFSAFVGADYAVMVNSGSSANLLAVAALMYSSEDSLCPGDEVIVPAVSWSTTYYPLLQYGLKVKFVDIKLDTLNIDTSIIESAISDKTKAIFAVNLLGNPNDFELLKNICEKYSLILIEDNCESLGASYHGKQTGTFGLLGTYSTFFSHHISTMEGGVVVTNNEELYHILLSLRSHGWTRHLPKKNFVTEKKDNPFYESFRFVLPGYNLRPLEFSGALGVEQLKKLPSIISGRRENAKVFYDLFSGMDGIILQKEIGKSSWFGFSMIFEDESTRNRVISLFSEKGVDCRPIVAGNFTRNEVIKYFDYEVSGNLIASDRVHDNGLFIGNHHYSISSELEEIRHNLLTIL